MSAIGSNQRVLHNSFTVSPSDRESHETFHLRQNLEWMKMECGQVYFDHLIRISGTIYLQFFTAILLVMIKLSNAEGPCPSINKNIASCIVEGCITHMKKHS